MTSTHRGEKRKDGQGADEQDPPKRHRSTGAFNFWAFFNELEGAMERHDYVRADELMHQDAALRMRANAKDLEVYAEQAPEAIKHLLEKIVNQESIIDQLSDHVEESRVLEMRQENKELQAQTERFRATVRRLARECLSIAHEKRIAEEALQDAKSANAAMQLTTGKLVAEKSEQSTQLDKQGEELKRARVIVRNLEGELDHMRRREDDLQKSLNRRDQESQAREQQLRVELAIVRQDQSTVNGGMHTFRATAQQMLERQKQEITKQEQELKGCKGKIQELQAQLAAAQQDIERRKQERVHCINAIKELEYLNKESKEQMQAERARGHKALMESEKELALLNIQFDEFKAAAAAAHPGAPAAAAAGPAFKVWTTCKEGDWAIICPSLHERIKTGEVIWIGQVFKFLYETDQDTGLRSEWIQIFWRTWDPETGTYIKGKSATIQRDMVLFYTDKLPANPAEKKALVVFAENHFTSCSTTAALPRRVAE